MYVYYQTGSVNQKIPYLNFRKLKMKLKRGVKRRLKIPY